ncbi:MAG TPA: trigger factor [Symbiobacteriaceae bacterium]|jgi:trigger factor
MKATWDKLEKNWMQFEIEVETDQFGKAIDTAFHKLNQKITVPGFRRGKAPRHMVERNYGKEALVQEAVEDLLPQVYGTAVAEHNIDPIDQPEIQLVQAEEGKPFIFKGKVQVVPEVTLGKLSGFGLEMKPAEVAEEQINRELDGLRERGATLVTDESGDVKQGSFAVIDFEGFVDDAPFEGGKAENYTLEIGSGSFIPGFEEQLTGLKVGDYREVNVSFPESYRAEHLAGKPALFKVTIKDVKKKEMPELNDAFAAEVSEFQTLADLKADITKHLSQAAEAAAEKEFQNKVVEAVAGDAQVEIPEVLVDQRIHEMIHDFEHTLSQQGYTLELWEQATGKTHHDLHTEFDEPAKKSVRNDLVLGAVARQANVTVNESDLEVEFDEMLARYPGQEKEINQLRRNSGYRNKMREGILVQKTVKHLVDLNTAPQG